jgi:hypothetical protein
MVATGRTVADMATTLPPDPVTLAEAAGLLEVSEAFASRLVDRHLLGPASPSGTLSRAAVLAYDERRRARVSAVADVTSADIAAGVPYR